VDRRPGPCIALVLALASCVTTYEEREVERRLELSASAVAGLGRHRVIAIHADSRVAAFGLLAEAKANRDSPLSAQVGARLAAAARRHQAAVVGGPHAELSDRVLCNALRLNQERGLGGLRLVFVSPEPPSRELVAAASQARVRLTHRAFR
jgi:hypothetical protein